VKLKPAVRVCRRISEIGRAGWDACAANPAHNGNPFVLYDFLDVLEETNCAVERTGWGPQHLAVDDEAGEIGAVMPLYLKSHSQGEYIFDHAWADAYERAGGRYYPKLLSAARSRPRPGPGCWCDLMSMSTRGAATSWAARSACASGTESPRST